MAPALYLEATQKEVPYDGYARCNCPGPGRERGSGWREMLRLGDSFHSIEAFLDSADLDPDSKAALWLLAWSEQGRLKRRGIINEAITAMARPQA